MQGSIMGVGGGIHDEAVDITYSTKPDQPQMAFGQGAAATTTTTTTTTSTAQYGFGGAEENTAMGLDLGATVGNTVNLGAEGMEFGGATTTTTTTTENAGFEFGAGAGAEATGFDTAESKLQPQVSLWVLLPI